jgi:hypothetical protein
MSTTEPAAPERSTPRSSASPIDSHTSPVAGSRRPGRAMAALVVGIIALLAALVIPIAGIVLGVVALVLGSNSRDELNIGAPGYSQAKAGYILGIVSIAVAIINWIVTAVILTS